MPELLPGPVETTPMPHAVGPVMMAVPGPPGAGGGASPELIAQAVDAYLTANPPAAPVVSVNGELGAVVLDAADVGADPAGTAAAAVAAHEAAVDPHPTYTTAAEAAAAAPVQSVAGRTGAVTLSLDDAADTATRLALTPAERAKLDDIPTRGLIITDTDVTTIPAGDAVDNLAAYYNSGSATITVQGTSIAAGAHAVWVWVSGAWTLLAAGTGGAVVDTLAAPVLSTPVATASEAVTTWGPVTGATGYAARIDGGTVTDLGNVLAVSTGAVGASHSGTIEVRAYSGTTYAASTAAQLSTWAVSAYTTESGGVGESYAPVRFVGYEAVTTASGDTTSGVSVTTTGPSSISSSRQGPVGATGYGVKIKFTTAPGNKVSLSLTSENIPGYNYDTAAISPKSLVVDGAKYSMDPVAATTDITAETGDVWQAVYTGSAVEFSVSKDDGATWLTIGSSPVAAAPTQPVSLHLRTPGPLGLAWIRTFGMTHWGDADGTEASQALTLPDTTGITNNGDGTYTLSNATGRGYTACDTSPRHLSITLTGLQSGVTGPRIWTANTLTPDTTPSGDRNVLTIGADHVITTEQTAAAAGFAAGPTNTGIVAADGMVITMLQRGGRSSMWVETNAVATLISGWPWWKSLTIDTPGGVGVGTVRVKLGVDAL